MLVLLDACRYDAFDQVTDNFDLSGRLDERYSRGSATAEFLPANFANRDLSDTVYVTGTSMFYRMTVLNAAFDHNLHDVVSVWTDAKLKRGNATPEQMAQATIEAREQYPNKRIVSHFIQPHIPFIGEFGRRRFGDVDGDLWQAQRRGELEASAEDLWKAYIENLHAVMPSVEQLLQEVNGRTVVTADHGQFIGDRSFPIPIKQYGHPTGIYVDELVKVPWFVTERGPRPEIVAEPPREREEKRGTEEMNERAQELLEDLGYV